MKYAVSVPNVGPPDRLVQFAVEVEQAGFDGFFVWDHLHLFRAMQLEVVDPWVLLGAIAQATGRVRLGTMVTPVARRRPWKLAKEIVTLDRLSGGRAICGFGLGFPPEDEFEAFGEDATLRGRAHRTDEALELLDALLQGKPVKHHGTHFQVDAHLSPACVQSPRPPFWIAATRPHAAPLRRALRWDGVFPIGDNVPLGPRELADYVGDRTSASDFTVVGNRHPDHTPTEYAEVGVNWLVESTWPEGDWLDELRARALWMER